MQYADEVVVVINLGPMKCGNGMEEKTRGTALLVALAAMSQKHLVDAKDRRNFEVRLESRMNKVKMLKES